MDMIRGSLVKPTAGKYKGLVMAVVDSDADYVYVADGRHRRLENTKRFNPKHVERLAVALDPKLFAAPLTNNMLWHEIRKTSVNN
jgi:ribosomal protein L14E/L6E/L27E